MFFKYPSNHDNDVKIDNLNWFRTHPVISVTCKAEETPLKYRRKKIILMYFTNLAQNPKIPAYQHFFKNSSNQIKLQKYSPILNGIKNFFNKYHIQIPIISKKSYKTSNHGPNNNWKRYISGI